jgi:hypothetical protein
MLTTTDTLATTPLVRLLHRVAQMEVRSEIAPLESWGPRRAAQGIELEAAAAKQHTR